MHGLKADLAWMEEVCPHCLPEGWRDDLTSLIDWWQEPTQHWTRLVKKVWKLHLWKLHLTQNAIMADAKMLHAGIFRNLRAAGATFDALFEDLCDWDERFDCFFSLQNVAFLHINARHMPFFLLNISFCKDVRVYTLVSTFGPPSVYSSIWLTSRRH